MERVLCLISCMNMGGAETFLMKVFRTIDRSQYQMDFCINVPDKCDYEDEICLLGGKIYRIPPKSSNPKAFRKQLTEVIQKNGYRHVLRITSNAAGFWDLKIAKKAGVDHTIARSSNASDGGKRLPVLIHRISRLLWMRYVDTKIAPSDLAAIYTFGKREYASGKVSILNNGLDLHTYCFDVAGREKVRAELGIGDDTTVIGHIGRFSEQKNHKYLLEIFSEYINQRVDSKLLLVGDGSLRKRIMEQAQTLGVADRVIFAGLRRDIPAVLSAMDVFVFPSFYEGMPNTVIEAQACGVPCVISDTITSGANVTGRVRFCSLQLSPEEWCHAVDESREDALQAREENGHILWEKGYGMTEVCRTFVEKIFGGV